jgi:hypothetical protein
MEGRVSESRLLSSLLPSCMLPRLSAFTFRLIRRSYANMSTPSITDVVNSSVQCLSHLPKDNKAVDEYVSKVEAGNVEDVKVGRSLDAALRANLREMLMCSFVVCRRLTLGLSL